MYRINAISIVSDQELDVQFDTGEIKRCDISRYFDKGIFRQLSNPKLFRQVRAITYGIEWPNEADLSSDTLYAIGVVHLSSE